MVCHLAGLFNMLSDNSHETRKQADAALSEFLQEIKNAPVLNCSLQEFSLKICKGFRGVILQDSLQSVRGLQLTADAFFFSNKLQFLWVLM
jgi:hypothetical protein